jgi:hypothetical protein
MILKEKLKLLNSLKENQKPLWGKMTPQHMSQFGLIE